MAPTHIVTRAGFIAVGMSYTLVVLACPITYSEADALSFCRLTPTHPGTSARCAYVNEGI
jgi:hypothetical protein